MIQVYSNSLGEEELAAISGVFKSKWLGMGSQCAALEKELGEYWGTENVLLLNNCTAGLFISLKALGIVPGDEVIISTANYVGCSNAILDAGAKPVFADVDKDYLNILPEEIARLRTPKTRAVLLLHYGGHACDFNRIREMCKGLLIIEDSANSVSSTYQGKACGTLSDAGVFSFDPMKIMVTGDGGALVLKDHKLIEKAKSLRYLGFKQTTTSGVDSLKEGNKRWWEFDLDNISGRYISNDIAATIGRIQLKKLPGFIKRRKLIWGFYQNRLSGISGLKLPPEPLPDSKSSYYMYWLWADGKRDELAQYLLQKGIYTTFRYFPLHLAPYYNSQQKLKNAESASENVLNLPLHQNLADSEVEHIAQSVKKFFT